MTNQSQIKKDFLGNELSIGDDVLSQDSHYVEFLRGTIERFTPQMVVVRLSPSKTYRKMPGQLVRILKNKEVYAAED